MRGKPMKSLGLKLYALILPLVGICGFFIYTIISPYVGVRSDLETMQERTRETRLSIQFTRHLNRFVRLHARAVLGRTAGDSAALQEARRKAGESLEEWKGTIPEESRAETLEFLRPIEEELVHLDAASARILSLLAEGKGLEAGGAFRMEMDARLEKEILAPIFNHTWQSHERLRFEYSPLLSRISRLGILSSDEMEARTEDISFQVAQILAAEGMARYTEEEARDLSAYLIDVDVPTWNRLLYTRFQTGVNINRWYVWVRSEEHKAELSRADTSYWKFFAVGDRVTATAWSGKRDAARKMLNEEMTPLLDDSLSLLDETIEQKERELAGSLAGIHDAIGNAAIATAALGAFVILIAVAAPILLFWMVLRPIRDLKLRAAAVGAGDLAATIPVTTGDELGQLADAFNQMIENLRNITVSRDSLSREMRKRERIEAELRRSQEMLRHAQKMEAVGRLAGGVAHEFNNMLSAILGFCDLSMRSMPSYDPAQEYLQQIRVAAERASTLTRRLLAFGRKQVIRLEVLNLNMVVADMQKMLRTLVGEKIKLRFKTSPDLPNVKADRSQIEQVLMNLVINARDAMPEGGSILLETSSVELDKPEISPDNEVWPGLFVLLSVIDDGTGIEPETLPHIFDPFFTTKEADKGTGLGLAMVYGVVHQMGGDVRVESEPDEGTRFRVFLPAVEEELTETTAEAPLDEPLESETILLVDDEALVMAPLVLALRDRGHTVVTALSGKEALDVFRRHNGNIDVVLADVVMPGMNGRELCDELHKIDPTLRVIYMSGHQNDVVAENGVLPENTMFVEKPIHIQNLLRLVSEVMEEVRESRS